MRLRPGGRFPRESQRRHRLCSCRSRATPGRRRTKAIACHIQPSATTRDSAPYSQSWPALRKKCPASEPQFRPASSPSARQVQRLAANGRPIPAPPVFFWKSVNLVRAVGMEPFGAVAPPYFRVRMNAAQQKQLFGRAPANEHDARLVAHDLGDQIRNLFVGKRPHAVRRERCQRAVIIQKQSPRRGVTHPLEKSTANVLLFRYFHSETPALSKVSDAGIGGRVRYLANKPRSLALKLETLFREETEEPSRDPEKTLAARADEGVNQTLRTQVATGRNPKILRRDHNWSLARMGRARAVESTWLSAVSFQPSAIRKSNPNPLLLRDGAGGTGAASESRFLSACGGSE